MASFKAALKWDVRITGNYFQDKDRRKIEHNLDEKTHKALFWFGGRVREKARQKIGKPVLPSKDKKPSKPRAPGNAPKARVRDAKNAVSLRNVQYQADIKKRGSGFGSVIIHGIKFSGTARNSGKSAPELHEYGGTARAQARVVTLRTKSGKPRQRKGQVQRQLIFSRRFPWRSFKIPKRPILAKVFAMSHKEFVKRLKEGRFS